MGDGDLGEGLDFAEVDVFHPGGLLSFNLWEGLLEVRCDNNVTKNIQ